MREQITNRAHGIDVSHHQEEFILAKTWGQIDFGIAKIGMGYNTPYNGWDAFMRLWEAGVGLLDMRGVYFYQKSGYSWSRQGELVLEALKRLDPKPQMLWLDLEKIGNVVDKTMLADAYRILELWDAEFPGIVGLYTNPDILTNYIQRIGLMKYGQQFVDKMCDYPLWLGQYWWLYSPNKQPATPKFHPNWKIWQYTDRGDKFEYREGIKMRHYGSPDLNVYNGTPAEMMVWLGL